MYEFFKPDLKVYPYQAVNVTVPSHVIIIFK